VEIPALQAVPTSSRWILQPGTKTLGVIGMKGIIRPLLKRKTSHPSMGGTRIFELGGSDGQVGGQKKIVVIGLSTKEN